MNPGFGDGDSWRVILIENPSPIRVHLVNLVAIEYGIGAVVFHDRECVRIPVWKRLKIFLQSMGDIDSEPIDAAVRPKAQGVQEVLVHLLVVPVEIRLLLCEQVHVPLAVWNLSPALRTKVAREP